MGTRIGLVLIVIGWGFAACDSGGAESSLSLPPAAPARPVLEPPSGLGLAVVTGDLPDTVVGDRLDWVLDILNVHIDTLTDEQVTEHFDPAILEVVAASDLSAELRRLNRRAPYALVGFVEEPTASRMIAVVADGMATYRTVTVEVGDKPEARLTSLNFQPYTPRAE